MRVWKTGGGACGEDNAFLLRCQLAMKHLQVEAMSSAPCTCVVMRTYGQCTSKVGHWATHLPQQLCTTSSSPTRRTDHRKPYTAAFPRTMPPPTVQQRQLRECGLGHCTCTECSNVAARHSWDQRQWCPGTHFGKLKGSRCRGPGVHDKVRLHRQTQLPGAARGVGTYPVDARVRNCAGGKGSRGRLQKVQLTPCGRSTQWHAPQQRSPTPCDYILQGFTIPAHASRLQWHDRGAEVLLEPCYRGSQSQPMHHAYNGTTEEQRGCWSLTAQCDDKPSSRQCDQLPDGCLVHAPHPLAGAAPPLQQAPHQCHARVRGSEGRMGGEKGHSRPALTGPWSGEVARVCCCTSPVLVPTNTSGAADRSGNDN